MQLWLAIALVLGLQAEGPKDPVLDGLRFLARHAARDGSWGGPAAGCSCPGVRPESSDPETTGLVLLSFLDSGYSELSRDEHDGKVFGDVVGHGLSWLITRQDREGAFDSDGTRNAVAALAVTEHHGATHRLRESAKSAFGYVLRTPAQRGAAPLWQALVLKSGSLADLGAIEEGTFKAWSDALLGQDDRLSRSGALLLTKWAGTRPPEGRAKELYDLHPLALTPLELHIALLALAHGDEDRERWHAWCRSLRKTMQESGEQVKESGRCDRGAWKSATAAERLRVTALRTLTLSHSRCFICRNPFRKSDR